MSSINRAIVITSQVTKFQNELSNNTTHYYNKEVQ